ncbi:hypothetical protein F0562_000640 [Nyssa sinensis]|uniref:soluble epoxide hydrolase n=1 Tax=Nyssa sinensis TaxID=561372 RepID=A0A5J5C1Z4_9ASTE|nr:hypothetical protein F0562_000640 [Nyssa sinensis]
MEGIEHKMVSVNGITMHVAEKGQGPLVLFIHGFPELWYSWRHQIVFLAAHGYRAVAPDLRGYGDTTGAPTSPAQYTTLHVVGDIVALLDAIAPEQEKVVKALVNLSVAFIPRNPTMKPLELFRAFYGSDYYICRFQEPGDIEAEFAKVGVKGVIKKLLTYRTPGPLYFPKGEGFRDSYDCPITLPSWLSEEDVDYYASKFEQSGFTGAVNYYRTLDLNWELTAPWTGAQLKVPVKFIVGDLDLAYHMKGMKEYIHNGGFQKDVPLLQEVVAIFEYYKTENDRRPVLFQASIFRDSHSTPEIHTLPGEFPLFTCTLKLERERESERDGGDRAQDDKCERHYNTHSSERSRSIGPNPSWPAHGYRAVAPDLRGYGDTTGAPTSAAQYTILHLVGDVVALLDAIVPEQDKMFVVGHDWGAFIGWHLCLFKPDRVKAFVSLSIAFIPRNPTAKLLDAFRALFGDDHYVCRFQEPGVIEAEFAHTGIRRVLKKFLTYSSPAQFYFPKGEGFGDSPDTPVMLPSWLSEEDVDYYASKYEQNGLTGGLNYYRAVDLNWELTAPWTGVQVKVPVKFTVGDLDWAYHIPGTKEYIHDGGFQKDVPLLQEVVVIEGATHFIQQEKADEINKHIYHFIQKF